MSRATGSPSSSTGIPAADVLRSLVVLAPFHHSWRSMGRYTCATFALLLAVSCTTPSALRTDTEAYVGRMSSWAPVEAETARTLERILATQFVDAAEVLRQIGDSSPRVQRHLEEITQYQPRTPELRRIHDAYTGLGAPCSTAMLPSIAAWPETIRSSSPPAASRCFSGGPPSSELPANSETFPTVSAYPQHRRDTEFFSPELPRGAAITTKGPTLPGGRTGPCIAK